MICVILAAGYATRLFPLTENFPKALLEIGEKPIIEHLIDDIESTDYVSRYILVSNHKYYPLFAEWAKDKKYNITVLDDGTETNETRLGAVRDIQFAVEQGKTDDDILVIASDNLLTFSLSAFIDYAREKNASAVMRYIEPDSEKIKRSAVVETDGNGRVIFMEEKPAFPKTQWCCPPFYFYVRNDVKKIKDAIESGCATDSPGSLAAWISARSPLFAMEMPGKRYNIDTVETYNILRNTVYINEDNK